ncbi:PREDICTED: RNA pseudouridine synthase 4, mitochondrial-like [Camelina sativa]|uniref:RNA pseudouridine synthase 4, mitochondrial-like n=1 Tax=Camelina sativa TaxID=90675 RepID=A0ABM0W5S9_CAMSA|nr:PREDICTED: RNA pseudouridine synthase 4, mitochondrial-like [Camelina sativa]
MSKWRIATATLHRHLQSQSPTISSFKDPTKSLSSAAVAAAHQCRGYSTAQTDDSSGKWVTLPSFYPTVDGNAVGKELTSDGDSIKGSTDGSNTTALRWILRCRPDLPRTLVQKLFRLRQVRREMTLSCDNDLLQRSKLKRVAAKESLNVGDRIFLPLSVDNVAPPQPTATKKEHFRCSEEERKFVCSLVLYKDPSIIVLNKPHGMAVQGGTGIKTSIDELAATCLTFDKSESPRLVHRLDRDCTGLLVLARTQTAATVLHSIFREKTTGASAYGVKKNIKSLKRKYIALVIGCPRRKKGQISAPLRKVVVDDGKSDRITVDDNGELVSTQHAITEYRVIESSPHGYTWLELRPLTGRKHQLRVHCAEVLGTPIVGDYKYGWQAHKTREPLVSSENTPTKQSSSPFGLDLDGGDVSSKQPHLHLHSKQIDLPNISQLLEKMELSSDSDISDIGSLKFDAPLPSHMQLSFNLLKSKVDETCDKN